MQPLIAVGPAVPADNRFRLDDKPDAFFEELLQFRRANKRECTSLFPEAAAGAFAEAPAENDAWQRDPQPGFRLDERGFPVESERVGDADVAHTDPLQQFIRVSVPRRVVPQPAQPPPFLPGSSV